MKYYLVFLIPAFFLTGSAVLAQHWIIQDNHSIRIDNFDITGRFEKFSGKIIFDQKDLAAARFDVAVDVKSLSTGNILKTTNALSKDWFDAGNYPVITFVSDRIEKSGASWKAVGNLTIRGIKKQVVIPFAFVSSGNEGGFSGEFTLNRTDYGVGDPESEVEYDVKVLLNVPVRK